MIGDSLSLLSKYRKNKKPTRFFIEVEICKKADDGNRTRLSTLGRSHSTDELHLLKNTVKLYSQIKGM